MKKIFLNRRNALLTPATLSLGVFFVLVVLGLVATRALFPGAFTTAAAPLFLTGSALTSFASDLRAAFSDSAELRSERDNLLREREALTSENLALTAKLKDLTALLAGAPTPSIVAGVLARPPESPYDSLVLASGSISGVSTGMRVFAPGNVPIGSVESVTASGARVALYSSPGNTLSAWVGEKRVPITLTGAGGGAFTASAPKAAPIEMGDIVYLAAGGAYPMGRIKSVVSDLSSPSATLYIEPTVNLFSLVWVMLMS